MNLDTQKNHMKEKIKLGSLLYISKIKYPNQIDFMSTIK